MSSVVDHDLPCRRYFAWFLEWKLEPAVQKAGFVCFCGVGAPCFNEFYSSRCRCSLVQLVPGSSLQGALFWPSCVFHGVIESGWCGTWWHMVCHGLGLPRPWEQRVLQPCVLAVQMWSVLLTAECSECPPVHPARGFSTESFSIKKPPHLKSLVFQKQIKSEDEQALAGVLLSLSGGVFRSNLLTQDDGMLTFSNLVSWNDSPERGSVWGCVTLLSQTELSWVAGVLWNPNPLWEMQIPENKQHWKL